MNKDSMINDDVISTISTEDYNSICNNVFDYMTGFNSSDKSIQQNYLLKREHINRVIGYSEVLTRSLELDPDLVMAAQLAALLHDIGRFEQYKLHQTFNDSISFDHAEKAVELISEKNWLIRLPDNVQQMIIKAIKYHNKISVPKIEDEQSTLLIQILRDADKIDILDIAIKEFSLPLLVQNQSFALDLEKKPSFSKKVANAILAGKNADKKDLHTVNDFKLMLMSYVFDINFKASFALINKRQYLKQLFDTLPKSDDIFEIYRKTKIHVENKLI
ncbi:MAG TPA: HD domain-containing protein [Prolixibacteraceae bacterium]|nr:HD domain-containing protein [Prolixibacteraceae bacterium]